MKNNGVEILDEIDREFNNQPELPYFDSYFKHNDYIQNFELAAAMDITQHKLFDTLMGCVQTLKNHNHQYLFENDKGNKMVKVNYTFFMQRYLKSQNIKSIKKSDLEKAAKSLAQIVVLKDTNTGGIAARQVFGDIDIEPELDYISIEIRFDADKLTPTKDTKSPGFTKLLSSKQVDLRSLYARVLYQFFLSYLAYKTSITLELQLEKIYKMFGLVDSKGKFLKGKKGYEDTSKLKSRCLTEPIESINKNTEIFIEFKDVKKERKIIGFIFTAKFNIKELEKTNDTENNQFIEFKPKKEDFNNKDEFVKHMKIYYKGKKITNNLPDYSPEVCLVIDSKGMLALEDEKMEYLDFQVIIR